MKPWIYGTVCVISGVLAVYIDLTGKKVDKGSELQAPD